MYSSDLTDTPVQMADKHYNESKSNISYVYVSYPINHKVTSQNIHIQKRMMYIIWYSSKATWYPHACCRLNIVRWRLYHAFNIWMIAIVAWLQSSTTNPQWFQYLKLVFLKISNVRTWLVFQNQITYMSCSYIYIDHLPRLIILLSSCSSAIGSSTHLCNVIEHGEK